MGVHTVARARARHDENIYAPRHRPARRRHRRVGSLRPGSAPVLGPAELRRVLAARARFPDPPRRPEGTVKGPVTLPSHIYPGVAHDYWVYVPAQYDGQTDVSLMVFNDGATYLQADGCYRAVNVLDYLIYRGELPLMIAAFIDPGKFSKDGASNRQAEYDPPDDRYSRVIVDELLPRLYAMPIIGLRVIRNATPSPAGVRGRLRRSRWRGSGPIISARS